MPDIVNLQSQERVDLGDLSYGLGLGQLGFQTSLVNAILATPYSNQELWVIEGFIPTNPSGAQLQVTLGCALLAYRNGANVQYGVVAAEGEATQTLDLTQYASGTYNIYIRFNYQPNDTSSRVFWNPANAGSEFAQSVPTRMSAAWELRVENANPGPEWLQIGTVTTPSMQVVDMRPLYFEGRVDQSYAIPWGANNDRSSDRSTYGIKDLQTFVQAVEQCLTDIKGPGIRKWYSSNIGGMCIGFDGSPVEKRVQVGDGYFFLGHDSPTAPTLTFDSQNGAYINYDRSAQQMNFAMPGVAGASNLNTSAWTFNLPTVMNSTSDLYGHVGIHGSSDNTMLTLSKSNNTQINVDLMAGSNTEININWYVNGAELFNLTQVATEIGWYDNYNHFMFQYYDYVSKAYYLGAPVPSACTYVTSLLNVTGQGSGATFKASAPTGQSSTLGLYSGSYAYTFTANSNFFSLFENNHNANILSYNPLSPTLSLGYSGTTGIVQAQNTLYVQQRNTGLNANVNIDAPTSSQQAAINWQQNAATVYQTYLQNTQWVFYDVANSALAMYYDYATRAWSFNGATGGVSVSKLVSAGTVATPSASSYTFPSTAVPVYISPWRCVPNVTSGTVGGYTDTNGYPALKITGTTCTVNFWSIPIPAGATLTGFQMVYSLGAAASSGYVSMYEYDLKVTTNALVNLVNYSGQQDSNSTDLPLTAGVHTYTLNYLQNGSTLAASTSAFYVTLNIVFSASNTLNVYSICPTYTMTSLPATIHG